MAVRYLVVVVVVDGCCLAVRLTRPYNKEDVVVTLPDTLDVDDLLWLSVWCIQFRVMWR